MRGDYEKSSLEGKEDVRELREAIAAVKKMLAEWLDKNAATLDPNLERLTPADLDKYQYLNHLSMFFPTDYLIACRENPDYLRVLAQDRLIDEKKPQKEKAKRKNQIRRLV